MRASAELFRVVGLSPAGDRTYPGRVQISAIVTAGDGPASKFVYGDNKVYLEVGGRALVVRVVEVLQRVPEVSEVWVVGNEERLGELFSREDLVAEIHKPLRIVPQFRNLYENAWQTFRRLFPGAGIDGRDPKGDEIDRAVLYVSGDLPFATPQEISEFIRRGTALDCDYAVGLVSEDSVADFHPSAAGDPGIQIAYFNLREGRFRQSNLHLAKPARIGNRQYIEDMYEHRYQKEFGNIARLAWTILMSEHGGFQILFLYLLIHLASVANRRGFQRIADFVRRFVSMGAVERAISSLLRTDYRFVITEAGGCAVDVDNEREFDVAELRFDEWSAAQAEKAERLYGPPALPSGEGT
jgi:GTP:adenosylcobinamide-phosphate guanylyltransferase